MAIVEMKKLKLIGLSSEKDRLLDSLQSLSCVEIVSTKEIDNTEKRSDESRRESINSSYAKIVFAIDFINEQLAERVKISKLDEDDFELAKKPFFFVKENISKDSFYGITSKEYELFSYIDELMQINSKLLELKSERTSLASYEESLGIYKFFNSPLNIFNDTKNVNISLGTIQKCDKELLVKIENETQSEIIVCGEDSSSILIFVTVLNENAELLNEKLSLLTFNKCPFNFDITAKQKSDELLLKIKEIDIKRKELIADVVNYEKYMLQLKQLYDYYVYLTEKMNVDSEFAKTKLSFILEGYYPKELENTIKNTLYNVTSSIELMFSNIKKGDNPPTLNKNNKIVAPFENVTNMFSVPKYTENDPNKYVSVFFILLFGIMLSDAGYGIILVLGGLLLIKFVKMETGMRRMVSIITLGGVSTIFWGVLFGGWFAIDIDKLGFLNKLCIFSPLNAPEPMLGLCLGVGVIQILFGMGIKAKDLIQSKHLARAIFDIGSWYLIFLGLGIIGINIYFKVDVLSKIGIYVSLSGVLLIILTAGRHEKSILMKILKGFAGLYGIMNYLSDILSYSRLFGLGLATGVVGMVMNKIAEILIFNMGIPFYLGLIPAIVILIVGHSFNIAINVLGAYVHNSRLQYIEFFSKFYEGGGHLFKPFGSNFKYTKII